MANGTLSPEEQLPGGSVPGPDPLEQLGYNEATTPAERALEIEQAEQPNTGAERIRSNIQDIQGAFRKESPAPTAPATPAPPQTAPSAGTAPATAAKPGSATKAVGQVKSGRGRLSQALSRADSIGRGVSAAKDLKENGLENAKEAVKDEVRQRAKQAAKEAAKRAAKAAGQALKKVALQIATKNPYVLAILGIILVIVIVLLLIFVGFSMSGKSGGGPPIKPSTQEEKYAGVQLLAISGDPQAKAEVITKEANELKSKLVAAKKTAQTKLSGSKQAAAIVAIDESISLIDQIIVLAVDATGRGPLIKQLNEKLTALEKEHSELFYSAGSCADLKPFIDSKQFIVGEGPNAKNIVEGKMATKVNGISPASQDLCGTLVFGLRAGFKIYTGTLSYGHKLRTSGGNISAHSCGAAIDIGMINGELVRSNSEETKKFLALIRQGHADKKIFIQQVISPFKDLYIGKGKLGSYTDSDHNDHIHLSGRPINPKCMQTGKP